MLSRHAEAVYWMGRYMERAENTARTTDVTYRSMLEAGNLSDETYLSWQWPLDVAFQRFSYLEKPDRRIDNDEQVMDFLCFDSENGNSVLSAISSARQNALMIRDVISSEMLVELNKTYRWVQEIRESGHMQESPHEFFQEIKTRCHLFEGVTANTMLRDEGWHFHQAGRWLERGMQTARILEVQYALLTATPTVPSPEDHHFWISVLKSTAAHEAYRRQYLTRVHPRQVVELLVMNPEFPRSVVTAARYLVAAAQEIQRLAGGERRSETDRLARRLAGQLSTTLVEEVLIAGVPQVLAGCQDQLSRIHAAISATYFTY